MWHQAGHVSREIADARDVRFRPVGITSSVVLAVRCGVAEKNLMILFKFRQLLFVAGVVPVAMRDWNTQNLTWFRRASEGRAGIFHTDSHLPADETQAGIAHHGPGQK